MSAPKRIEQRRTKGWRMPDNAVSVARPHRYGNPFKIGDTVQVAWEETSETRIGYLAAENRAEAVAYFRDWLNGVVYLPERIRPPVFLLAGKDLACFCPLDQPCHADVLLELANGGAS